MSIYAKNAERYQKERQLVWMFSGEQKKLYSQFGKTTGWINFQ